MSIRKSDDERRSNRGIGSILRMEFWKRQLKKQFMNSSLSKVFCWITRSLTSRFLSSDRWDILLHCGSAQEAQHLKLFSEIFRDDHRARFKIMVKASRKKAPSVHALIKKLLPFPEVSSLRAYLCEWDMIIGAGHAGYQLLLNPRNCPTIYIGHGPQNKCRPGSETTITYDQSAFKPQSIFNLYKKDQPIYSRMFEEDEKVRDLIIETIPSLNNVISVVGDMFYDNVLSEAKHREKFRRQLGIGPDETSVFVLSTWRPECLIESVGDAFLEESRRLLEEFKFIISVHPNEYVAKYPGQRVWGEYLRTQRKHGYIIREPDEDFIPHMVACDIVLTDHTCLADYAMLLQKPIICVPVNREYIWKGSITWQLYQFAPVLSDMRNLRKTLLEAKTNYPMDKLKALANEMNPYAGQSTERIKKEIYEALGSVN